MNFLKFMLRFGAGILTTTLIACSSAPATSNATSNPDSMMAQSQTTPSSAVELPAPMWLIDWQACGVINPFDVSVRGCMPDMRIARDQAQGDMRPEPSVVMWADQIQAPEDIHIETDNNPIGGVRAYLFVRSKGCVNRPPGAEDFYFTGASAHLTTRRVNQNPLPQAQWTVTPRQLSKAETAPIVEQLEAQAARQSSGSYQLSGTRGMCLPLEEWRSL